ncbi:VanZ family protein [Paenibacillus lentus]|uniref:VanZ-like domain-containing protein n=1 Tax=Paenibacillus lentus TaxID=1338368 RepID=A0A3Q8SAV8_9BACL|nr:VanZ family protein [Paenibacillus lentus]AZK46349.1 hypothetical protein EIM92_09295 [Paenibacillus lentus]
MGSKLHKRWGDQLEKSVVSRWLNVIFCVLFIVYVFIAIKIIMFKTIPFSALFHTGIMPALRSINMIPFNTIIEFFTGENMDMGRALENIGGNIAIFVPFGVFLAYVAHRRPFHIPILWLLFTSFTLEIIQYVLALGSSDIDDILLNFIGGVLGIGIHKWFYKSTTSRNQLLISLIGFFLVTGLSGGIVIRMIEPELLSFSTSKISYVYENNEVMAGWNEAEADLFGDLTAADTNIITVYMNPKSVRTTEQKEISEEYVHIQINDATRLFSRTISSDKNTVISKYEALRSSDISSLLETRDITPTVRVWLLDEDKQVAEAILISIID